MSKEVEQSEMKFLLEQPSSSDDFKGGSHSYVAIQIAETFETQPEIKNICLEGDLGSGKSTVIALTEKMLAEKGYVFTTFDVEKYQHSATKKALVTTLAESIASIDGQENAEEIREAQSVALGNQFDYEKTTHSSIPGATAVFALLLLFSTQALKPALESLSLTINTLRGVNSSSFDLAGASSFLILFSPVLFLLAIKLLSAPWLAQKYKFCRKLGKSTFGNLLKRNSTDRISETLLVNREVGSLELQQAFEVFSNKIPKNINYVLVIDNLDRVSDSEKVRDIWSDIELFISSNVSNFRLIVPFSSSQISSAISDDPIVGRESVTKQFPVRFWVSPIVSAGWREAFNELFKKSFIKHDLTDEQIDVVADLLEVWCGSHGVKITPRLLKQYLNGIISTIKCSPDKVSPIIAAYYYMSVRYLGVDFKILMQRFSAGVSVKGAEKAAYESQRLMRKNFSDTKWSMSLICIHFQSTQNIAMSEWLVEPLKAAIKRRDVDEILSKKDTFGFDTVCKKMISECPIEEVLFTAEEMVIFDFDESSAWIDRWLKEINIVFNESYIYSSENLTSVLSALEKLSEHGFEVSNESLNSLFESIDRKARNYSRDKNSIEKDELNLLYRIGVLANKKPRALTQLTSNSEIFVELIWPYRKDFPEWNLDKCIKNSGQALKILKANVDANGNPIESSLFQVIGKFLRVGDFDSSGENGPASDLVILNHHEFNMRIKNDDFYALPFDTSWRTTNYCQEYISNCELMSHERKQEYLAQTLSHIIQHQDWNTFESYRHIFTEYESKGLDIARYIPFIESFNNILNGMHRDGIAELINDSVKRCILGRKVGVLSINELAIRHYGVLKAAVGEPDLIIGWVSGWETHVKSDSVKHYAPEFVKDVLGSRSNKQFAKKLLSAFESNYEVPEDCVGLFKSPTGSEKAFVRHFKSSNTRLKGANAVVSDALLDYVNNSPSFFRECESSWLADLLDALKVATFGKVHRAITAQYYLSSVGVDDKYILMSKFPSDSTIILPQNENDEANLIMLYENSAGESAEVKERLDKQKLSLDSWTSRNKSVFLEFLKGSKDEFPRLNKVHCRGARIAGKNTKKRSKEESIV
ncbi:P-loop NTPase fold protein [Paraferrimonas sedimenticola]|uniref:KAP NTPase domain-containing protein n=1 Tax=Paraferrimonas sedimenticola TaxID=375674 RepID=A0AA37RQN5_9GAMM|nr:P-loop NTPase fold protein [Paraferrimonas sedimenticola]GLP94698.1 hypothetical protein GCM10007895_00040 [Paraferrimonas sedimenticola]